AVCALFYLVLRHAVSSLFPYTTLFRSVVSFGCSIFGISVKHLVPNFTVFKLLISLMNFIVGGGVRGISHKNMIYQSSGSSGPFIDRKSTRLNSSHVSTSYAVFCLQKRQ